MVLLCRNNVTINARVKTKPVQTSSDTQKRDPTRLGQNLRPGDRDPETRFHLCLETLSHFTGRLGSLVLSLKFLKTRMWANAQPDGRPAEHRWRPLFNAAKFG